MIAQENVFEAVRRGYSQLSSSSNSDILSYFGNLEPGAMTGHISNIKGIVFEKEVTELLNQQGVNAMLFEKTNHPISDIALMDDGDIAAELQLKATDSLSYINNTLAAYPDIPIVTTSEVANSFDLGVVINSGMSNAALENSVSQVLSGEDVTEHSVEAITEASAEALAEVITDVAFPISPIGLLFGLPF